MPIKNEFSAEEEQRMRKGFSPQGNTGGGVNMPGLLSTGKPAVMRSESTEHERARRADPGPAPILQHLISPENASFRDVISSRERKRKAATGDYDE